MYLWKIADFSTPTVSDAPFVVTSLDFYQDFLLQKLDPINYHAALIVRLTAFLYYLKPPKALVCTVQQLTSKLRL